MVKRTRERSEEAKKTGLTGGKMQWKQTPNLQKKVMAEHRRKIGRGGTKDLRNNRNCEKKQSKEWRKQGAESKKRRMEWA